jgi:hypothetical protein
MQSTAHELGWVVVPSPSHRPEPSPIRTYNIRVIIFDPVY